MEAELHKETRGSLGEGGWREPDERASGSAWNIYLTRNPNRMKSALGGTYVSV